jgi:PPOX class probable F420-dependent enzyme
MISCRAKFLLLFTSCGIRKARISALRAQTLTLRQPTLGNPVLSLKAVAAERKQSRLAQALTILMRRTNWETAGLHCRESTSVGAGNYDRRMTSLTESVRQVLEGRHLAHLVTLRRDGSPQVTIVWVGLDGDEIVAAHLSQHKKVANIQRDPRVAVSIETGRSGPGGLDEYLVVYGTARITEGGAPELLQRLAGTYLGPDVHFPPMDNPPAGFITHITVDRVAGNGPWAG